MQKVVKKDYKTLKGEPAIPSDKSVSHRAIILSSLAHGKSIIKNFSTAKDPHSTLNVCRLLGLDTEFENNTTLIINSTGKYTNPKEELYCGNSGTTMRLMSGVLAGQNFSSILTGDESLTKRPMKRIIEPLELMGAQISSSSGKSPLKITGSNLHAIDYTCALSSAQVKSCVLLAGLNAEGKTTFTEPFTSRNHTEILLKYMGANIDIKGNTTTIEQSTLNPIETEIFADISSASYFIASGLIVPNAKIILRNIGLNPTRTGIIKVIKQMGANIEILAQKEVCSELVGDIKIEYSQLKGAKIGKELIPSLIDELPIIAVIATQAEGKTEITGASDLRNKESDRIKAIVTELKKLGADIKETPDGMIINGKTQLKGDCELESYNDHRIAMSLYVAGLVCQKEVTINDFEWVDISFPEFETLFEQIKQ